MANANPIRFTLSNGAEVTVKEIANNKYDFELKLPNGNRKTFVWSTDSAAEFTNGSGKKDGLVAEAIQQFTNML
ncbi:MAG: hypothetical protein JO072_12335 [Parafilimonas sp.]|nr:hypothetical protein [Parafilimonas sp.]